MRTSTSRDAPLPRDGGMSLAGVIHGKPKRTMFNDGSGPRPRDHVNEQFRAPAPDIL